MLKEAARDELRLVKPAAPAPEVVRASGRPALARMPASTPPAAMSSRLERSRARPGGREQLLREIQKTFGNAYAQKVIERYRELPRGKVMAPAANDNTERRVQLQSASRVSSPGDPAEREAESTAKRIVRMPAPAPTPSPAASGGEAGARGGGRVLSPRLHPSGIARSPEHARRVQERRILPAIARKGDGAPRVPPQVAAEIESGGAAGRPLPTSVRRFMEPRFRADFGQVRIHTGDRAARLSRQLRAQAFTFGNHIYFGQGQWNPETPGGQELIAHELTHTVQQGAAVQRSAEASITQHSAPQVQRLGMDDALDYFADKANLIPGFRMFTIVLGVNPINMSPVERSAANILRALVEFIPGGGLITEALDKYGVFEKAGGWVEQQLKSLGMTGSAIYQAVMDFVRSVSLADLLDLGGVWERAKRIFTEPIDRLISFAKGLASGILQIIKDAILRPLAKLAEGTAGWDLLKAVLGQDPITGEAVQPTADNLIGGFMKLIGQEEIWNNLKRANAVARAWAWFQGALRGLMGFVRQIPGLFLQALRSLEIADIVILPRAFAKVGAVFGGFLGSFMSWAGNTVWDLLEIIFAVVAPGVMGYLRKAAGAFKTILKNPIGFVGNLVRAGAMGLRQFAGNFLKHLRASLIGWITGALSGAGVYIPQGFNLREIIKFVLSVLGLTWQNIRQKLVRVIGDPAVRVLETGFDIVLTLVTQGPAAAWEKIQESLSNLREMVMEQIMTFVRDRVVVAAITKLASMLTPAGAFIQAIIGIYNTVMFFVERMRQIAQVAASFIDSIAAIASGALGAAASRVEQTMAGLLTLVISFLARIAGLGKVSTAVTNVVNRVRAPIDRALDRVVAWIVTQAKRLGRLAAQAGVPQDPNERLRLAARAAIAAARRLRGRVGRAVLDPILSGIKLRYGLQDIQPYEQGGTWWARLRINPLIVQNLDVPSGARAPEGPSFQPLIGKLTQVIQMFTLWVGKARVPIAQQMLRQAEIAREHAQALEADQSRGVMGLEPRKQALAAKLRAIQTLDPKYALVSIGEMAITVVNAKRRMELVRPTPWTMLDPILRPEYERQLRDQTDGINAMVVPQWLANRNTYIKKKRSAEGRRLQREWGKRMGNPKNAAAPHNPDQVSAGYPDPTGPVARSDVNSHVGSQWPSRITVVETAAKAIDPASQLVTQMNVKLEVV